MGWRFYHHFDTSPHAPLRRAQPGVRTSVLAARGDDLAAAIATLEERGDAAPLHEAVSNAFPGYEVLVHNPSMGEFAVGLAAPELRRPLTAASLHPDAVRALAPLILQAAQFGQVWVATHDRTLRDALAPRARLIDLVVSDGETIAHSPGG